MKYVIDASIGFKWEVPEVFSDKALQLRTDFRGGIHELLAPDFLPIELGNAFLIAERRGRVPVGYSALLYSGLMASLPMLFSSIALFPRAFEIAAQYRLTVYDCLYVALAEKSACDLVTADDRLVNSLLAHVPNIVSLKSL